MDRANKISIHTQGLTKKLRRIPNELLIKFGYIHLFITIRVGICAQYMKNVQSLTNIVL